MKINTPNDARRKIRLEAFFCRRGKYTNLSIAIPRNAQKTMDKKKDMIGLIFSRIKNV